HLGHPSAGLLPRDAQLVHRVRPAHGVVVPDRPAVTPLLAGEPPRPVPPDGPKQPDVHARSPSWYGQALVDEHGERLPGGRPGDAVLVHERVLAREPITIAERAGQDLLAQPIGDAAIDRGLVMHGGLRHVRSPSVTNGG